MDKREQAKQAWEELHAVLTTPTAKGYDEAVIAPLREKAGELEESWLETLPEEDRDDASIKLRDEVFHFSDQNEPKTLRDIIEGK